ncbi:hypothetical protein [Aureimonas jatrophae]|uniref:Uncharacterized protein n=1 Tax=Aureimonas jatrophae TaxID=1166073 RepID=A0A1H0K3H6_9HYPH|nr:hypothetical protein [Aureimonas jatrophae]MBB3950922.1 hypothetical protein [Aureimonas jatrophae]SDO50300.1 hypothetical protein SAMN05192530_10768 [Aureimonas jatrophae]
MSQDSTSLVTEPSRARFHAVADRSSAGRPVHVVTLLVAMPVIGALAAATAWALGGTGWQMGLSVLASWFLIQLIYAAQIAFYATKSRYIQSVERIESWCHNLSDEGIASPEFDRDADYRRPRR